MDWEMFVKSFVADIDEDIAKNYDPATAETPEDVPLFLADAVASAKRYAEQYLGIKGE